MSIPCRRMVPQHTLSYGLPERSDSMAAAWHGTGRSTGCPGLYRPVIFRHVQPPLVHVQPPLVACAGPARERSRSDRRQHSHPRRARRGSLPPRRARRRLSRRPPPRRADALAWRSINAIRALAMDAVEKAKSGHPGTPMALAPAGLRAVAPVPPPQPAPTRLARPRPVRPLLRPRLDAAVRPAPPDRVRPAARRPASASASGARRRRAIPSAATRRASRPPPGRWARAFGNAVGMAIAERFLAEHFNRAGPPDHRPPHLGLRERRRPDGGRRSEAASLAGHLRLGKLTLIYDDNHITIDGDTALAFSEDVPRALRGLRLARRPGRRRQRPRRASPRRSRRRAPRRRARRSIALRTFIADPAPDQAQHLQGARRAARRRGGPARPRRSWAGPRSPPFFVPEDALDHWREAVPRGAALEARMARGSRPTRRRPRGRPRAPAVALRARCPTGGTARSRARRPSEPLATRQASGLALAGARGGRAEPGRRLRRPRRQHRHHAQAGRRLRPDDAPAAPSTGASASTAWRACLNGIAAHGGLRAVRQHLPGLLRLHEAGHPPRGDHAAAGHLHRHARLHRPRRGRTDPPADRAPGHAAGDPQPGGPPPGRRHRDHRGVARGHRRGATGPRCWCSPARSCRCSTARRSARPPACARGAYVLLDPPGGTPQAILIATGSEVHVALAAASCSRPTGCGCGWSRCRHGSCSPRSPRATATRCCRRACACGSASRRRARSDGSGGSPTTAPCSAWRASAPPRRASACSRSSSFTADRAAAIVRTLLAHDTSEPNEGNHA